MRARYRGGEGGAADSDGHIMRQYGHAMPGELRRYLWLREAECLRYVAREAGDLLKWQQPPRQHEYPLWLVVAWQIPPMGFRGFDGDGQRAEYNTACQSAARGSCSSIVAQN